MASYSLLNAFSGFSCNLADGEIGFNPIAKLTHPMKFFWSLGSGWGSVEIGRSSLSLTVLYGRLNLRKIIVPDFLARKKTMQAFLDGRKIVVEKEKVHVRFGKEICIGKNDTLKLVP